MLNIGDMYRKINTFTPRPSIPANVAPKTWINYPASIVAFGTQIRRLQFGIEHTINIQGIVFNNITVPEDAEPLPETLVMRFLNNPTDLVETFDTLFDAQYGKLFSIRSEAHLRIFIGTIPYWEVIDSDDCSKDLVIQMDVKESHQMGV